MLLLQHRGRMSAAALARELEVSTRTVLRDVEALSSVGIPVYAERGRAGGFALLPGFSTDLTGLTHDEALALLVAGSRATSDSLGMAPALASAMRKVVAALPQPHPVQATRDAGRVLVRDEGWRPRAGPVDEASDLLAVVRHAVFAGRRLRLRYAPRGGEPRWRVVDPVGLVRARDAWYLLATRDGAERTYRLSRMLDARELDEPADRPAEVDLDGLWRDRRERFGAQAPRLAVTLRVAARHRPDVVRTALAILDEAPDFGGWLRLRVEFADRQHAEGVVWALSPHVEVLEPDALRAAVAARAAAAAAAYAGGPPTPM